MLETVDNETLVMIFLGLVVLGTMFALLLVKFCASWMQEMFGRYTQHKINDLSNFHRYKIPREAMASATVNLFLGFLAVCLIIYMGSAFVDASEEISARNVRAELEAEKKVLMYQLKLYREASDWAIGGRQKLTIYAHEYKELGDGSIKITSGPHAPVKEETTVSILTIGGRNVYIVQEGSEERVQEVSKTGDNDRKDTHGLQTARFERGL